MIQKFAMQLNYTGHAIKFGANCATELRRSNGATKLALNHIIIH